MSMVKEEMLLLISSVCEANLSEMYSITTVCHFFYTLMPQPDVTR